MRKNTNGWKGVINRTALWGSISDERNQRASFAQRSIVRSVISQRPDISFFLEKHTAQQGVAFPVISDFPAKCYFYIRTFIILFGIEPNDNVAFPSSLTSLCPRPIARPFAFVGELAWPSLLDCRGGCCGKMRGNWIVSNIYKSMKKAM